LSTSCGLCVKTACVISRTRHLTLGEYAPFLFTTPVLCFGPGKGEGRRFDPKSLFHHWGFRDPHLTRCVTGPHTCACEMNPLNNLSKMH